MRPFDHTGSSPTQLTTRMHRRAIRVATREPVWQFGWQFVGALGNSGLTSIAARHAATRAYRQQPNSADNSHAQPDNSGGNSRASLAIRVAIRGQFLAIRTWFRQFACWAHAQNAGNSAIRSPASFPFKILKRGSGRVDGWEAQPPSSCTTMVF